MTNNTHQDTAAIEQTLRDWYAAIEQQDLLTVEHMLTDNFLIIEHTEIFTKAQLMARFEQAKTMGKQTAELSEFKTRVQGDVAWTTLHNSETWIPSDGSQELHFEFIETVVLLQQNDQWLIDRYHATSTKPLADQQ